MSSFGTETAEITYANGESLTLHAGDLVNTTNDTSGFNTSVILGFSKEGYARLARPYAYPSGVGTTSPSALLGCETYEVSLDYLARNNIRPPSNRAGLIMRPSTVEDTPRVISTRKVA